MITGSGIQCLVIGMEVIKSEGDTGSINMNYNVTPTTMVSIRLTSPFTSTLLSSTSSKRSGSYELLIKIETEIENGC